MKKLLVTILGAFFSVLGAWADEPVEKFGVFNHMSVGVGVGTTGLGFQIAFPITDYLALRGGYSFLPANLVKPSFNAKYDNNKGDRVSTKVGTKLNMGDADILIDIYPGKKTGLHITGGFFIGKERLVTAENKSPIIDVKPGEGLIIGDYNVDVGNPGEKDFGQAHAAIQVKKFKPYVGLGYGRAVPSKRVNFAVDLGVMFWGKPEVYGKDHTANKYVKVTKDDTGEEAAKYWKYLEKVKIYPVLTFRLNGRIF